MKALALEKLKDLAEPTAVLWLFLVLGWFYFWIRGVRGASRFIGLLVVLFVLVGSLPIPGLLLAQWERPFREQDLAALPQVDAVVVLGGGVSAAGKQPNGINLGKEADRVTTGWELMRMGKARALVLGGGKTRVEDDEIAESEVVKQWTERLGVVSRPIIALPACRDTHDEALRTRELMTHKGWSRIILVTSASHMSRAKALFESAGIEQVIPAACDFNGTFNLNDRRSWHVFPTREGLDQLSRLFYELVGSQYNKWRGWIGKEAQPGGQEQDTPSTAGEKA